jgi:hypothetical protein
MTKPAIESGMVISFVFMIFLLTGGCPFIFLTPYPPLVYRLIVVHALVVLEEHQASGLICAIP